MKGKPGKIYLKEMESMILVRVNTIVPIFRIEFAMSALNFYPFMRAIDYF